MNAVEGVHEELLTFHSLKYLDDTEEFDWTLTAECPAPDTCWCMGTGHGAQGRLNRDYLWASWWETPINMKKTFCTAINLPEGTELKLYFGCEQIEAIPASRAARTLGVWWAADLSVHGCSNFPGQFDIVANLIGEADQSRRAGGGPT